MLYQNFPSFHTSIPSLHAFENASAATAASCALLKEQITEPQDSWGWQGGLLVQPSAQSRSALWSDQFAQDFQSPQRI